MVIQVFKTYIVTIFKHLNKYFYKIKKYNKYQYFLSQIGNNLLSSSYIYKLTYFIRSIKDWSFIILF